MIWVDFFILPCHGVVCFSLVQSDILHTSVNILIRTFEGYLVMFDSNGACFHAASSTIRAASLDQRLPFSSRQKTGSPACKYTNKFIMTGKFES